jgi:Zn-dependent protease with chaperone function
LIVYFIATVVAIVAIIYMASVGIAMWLTRESEVPFDPFNWHPQLLATVVLLVLATIALGCLYKLFELGGSGERVAELLGGSRIPANTRELDERIILNVVEEMALASGTPVPPVYLLRNEHGINAFAAGMTPQNAVIGITRGAVEALNREQLQGVIAHEFSHILNGDMRLNLRLISLLHGIMLLAMIGFVVLRIITQLPVRARTSDKDDAKGVLAIIAIAGAIGVTLIAVGYIGVFFANLIQAAVSRQREFLADASAVQFTRNPNGIADALKRIGGWKEKAVVRSTEAREASHMFFGQGSRMQWFATHPPLPIRIQRIDPTFQGEFAATETIEHTESELIDPKSLSRLQASFAGSHQAAQAGVEHFERKPNEAVESVGKPLDEHIDHAHQLVEDMDEKLVDEVRDPLGAVAVVYALLLAPPGDAMRLSQLAMITDSSDRRVVDEVNRILSWVDALEAEQRLPTACLAFPGFGQLSERQAASVERTVRKLIEADRSCSFFEYAIQRFVSKRLVHTKRPIVRNGNKSLQSVAPACHLVLSTLAYLSAGDDAAECSYEAGIQALSATGRMTSLLSREHCTLKNFDAALNQLEGSSPQACKQMLQAFSSCIAADGMATIRELEVLRVVSDALGCPMPPILDLGQRKT